MNDSVEIEVVGSVLVADPGSHGLTHERELSFSTPATDAKRQVKAELGAFPKAELALQL